MLEVARIVDIIKPADHGKYGAQIVKLSFHNKPHEITAYAKKLSDYELSVELLTALLGRALGLPIPQPVIALSLDNTEVWFASVDAKAPDLTSRLNMDGNTMLNTEHNLQILSVLARCRHIDSAISFDEWILNDDRNTGNVLYDGDSFQLIDHNRAMRNTSQPAAPLCPNQLLNIKLAFCADDISQQRLKNRMTRLPQQLDNQLPREIADAICLALPPLDSPDLDNMVNFLEQRLNHLAPIAQSKMPSRGVAL